MVDYETELLIIGGGVIGVCAAYYAAKAGCRVTLLEGSTICSGCSRGNAGWLVPSHCIPLASPGALRKGLKWMWSGTSPFSIRPRLDWALLKWLVTFAGSCKQTKMKKSIPVLKELTFASLDLYRELCSVPGVECDLRNNGTLMVYATRQGLEEGYRDAGLLEKEGITSEMWSAEQVMGSEPQINPKIAGGIFYPQDAQIYPGVFVESLALAAQKMGASVFEAARVTGFRLKSQTIAGVQTTRGEFQPKSVILAAGADSTHLSRALGIRLPIEGGKGYSFSVPSDCFHPSRPLLLSEAKVAVTPFSNLTRFGGTLELGAVDLSIDAARMTAIRDSASRFLALSLPDKVEEEWSGLRPCTPDGLPIISRIPSVRNLVVASGHAMLGMSLGPISGKLAAQLALDQEEEVYPDSLSLKRFHL